MPNPMKTSTLPSPSHLCIAWIPTLVHERPEPLNKPEPGSPIGPITGSLFRISDYTTSDPDIKPEDILDLWGQITLVPVTPNPHKIQSYNIQITVYKCTDLKILKLIQKLNRQRSKLRTSCKSEHKKYDICAKIRINYRSRKVRRIDRKLSKLKPTQEKLSGIQQLHLSYCHCSRNGMMCYTYNPTPNPTPRENNRYNVFENGNIPACVYHQIKSLFHRHEFHDKEHDAQFSLFSAPLSEYPDIQTDSQNRDAWNAAICGALAHYIKGFEGHFHSQRETALERWSEVLKSKAQFLNIFDARYWTFSGIIAGAIPILTWVLCHPIFSISHGIFLYIAVFFLPLFFFVIIRWNKQINKNTSERLLHLEGEYGYAQSLLHSKYNNDNDKDSYRRSEHNIHNDFQVAKAYVEAQQRKGHTQFAILSISISIIFLIAELVVAFGLDYKSTETITGESQSIQTATDSVKHEVLKLNPKADSPLIRQLEQNAAKQKEQLPNQQKDSIAKSSQKGVTISTQRK